MPEQNFAIFETAIGACGIVWNARGLTGVQLPKKDEAATRARVQQRYPSATEAPPSPLVAQAIDGITALLRGEARDLTGIAIDNSRTPEFNAKVYAITREVPPARRSLTARSPTASATDFWRAMSAQRSARIPVRS